MTTMTVLMQCLGCGTLVKNPKVMNYMYEKCDYCTAQQKELEDKAVDTFLHQEAERKANPNAS